MNAELLKIICCPETHQILSPAAPELMQALNQRIATGQLKNRAGQLVADKMDGGLLRADGEFLYPIRAGIPILLIDEAIGMTG